jgi:hypothetical protein
VFFSKKIHRCAFFLLQTCLDKGISARNNGTDYPLKSIKKMPMHARKFFILLGLFLGLLACADKNNNEPDPIVPSATYDAANFAANASPQLGVRTALLNLVAEMKKGRSAGVKVELSTLSSLYTAGSPSLKSYTSAYYAGKSEGDNGFLSELSKASGGTFVPGTTTGNGGTYGEYLFDENGVELEQLIEKGLYGAALYNQAISLMASHIQFTPIKADQLVAVYGAAPTFKSSDNASKHGADNIDRHLASYAAQRDKNDGQGYYTQMKTALIAAQAAAKAVDHGKMLEVHDQIRTLWEKINAATVIYCCHTGAAQLGASNPSTAQKAQALHTLNEAIALLHGWRGLSSSARKITDAQIDELLALLNYSPSSTPKPYLFLSNTAAELPKLTQVISKLKSLYQFTDAEIEAFKKNWVAEQGR